MDIANNTLWILSQFEITFFWNTRLVEANYFSLFDSSLPHSEASGTQLVSIGHTYPIISPVLPPFEPIETGYTSHASIQSPNSLDPDSGSWDTCR